MKVGVFLLMCCWLAVLPAGAKIRLPAVLTDRMVLQQRTQVNLWGKTDRPGKVTVCTSWNDRTYTASVSPTGDWSVQVPTPVAGGPYTITVSDGEPVTLADVLVGEVWFCSGQSNMEMPVKGFRGQPVEGSADAIALASPRDLVRMITVRKNASGVPLDDCSASPWLELSPRAVAECSATAYFFARYLQRALGVPVGIICSSWGGSRIESWVGKEVYDALFPEVSLEVLKKEVPEIERPQDEPALLYNAMVHPLKRYTVRGAVWYQGRATCTTRRCTAGCSRRWWRGGVRNGTREYFRSITCKSLRIITAGTMWTERRRPGCARCNWSA